MYWLFHVTGRPRVLGPARLHLLLLCPPRGVLREQDDCNNDQRA